MQPRSQLVLDAAIHLVGVSGIRALTHRAVDAQAGLPPGSTSNLYRTRSALLTAMVSRLVDTELAGWDQLAAALHPSTVDALADALATTVATLTGPLRPLTVARYALFLEATRDPALQADMARAADRVAAIGIQWLTTIGSPDPVAHTAIMMAHLDGVMLQQLAFPAAATAGDTGPRLRALLQSLLGPGGP